MSFVDSYCMRKMTWAKGSSLSKNQRQKSRRARRTHTAFDGYENVPFQAEDSHNALSRFVDRLPRPRAPSSQKEVIKSLLLLAFIDEKCKFEENNSVRRRKLFNAICQSLSNIGIVDQAFPLAELDHILLSFRNGFSEMMLNAQLGLQHLQHTEFPVNVLPNLNLVSILRHFPTEHLYFDAGDIPHKSRYLEEFEELGVIGQGGFGIVFKAQKLVDNCIYAIKKISFFYRSHSSLEKVAREVEFLAKLNHPNIVTYKTAWIEYELQSSGESTTMSSRNSTKTDTEISIETRYKQESKSENDSIQFLDEESVLQNYDQNGTDTFMEYRRECQRPILSIQHNQNDRSFTSLEFLENCIDVAPCLDSELTETSQMNSYTSLSIKEITCSTEIMKEESNNSSKMEDSVERELLLCSSEYTDLQFDEKEKMYNYDGIPSSSFSRQRHGSGATCKSHSDSEIDDVFTVQRKKTSTIIDLRNLPLARCVSVDTTCKLLPLFQATDIENNFPVPFSSWHLKGTLYIQMELCAESLRDWLDERDSRKPQSQEDMFDKVCEKEVMSIFRQVLKGVEHIHSLGLIHRDLKPQNIFFDCNHSKVKIGDFGLAACYCDPERGCILWMKDNSHTVGVGTTPYAALEQRCGQIYDSMADMYSLGVILVELLHPFGTKMERAECLQKLCDVIIPTEIIKRWPDKANMIERLLNKDPKLRPSATEVLNSSLFLNKTQVIKNLQKDIGELKKELKLKEKIIEERDKEIIKLKKMLEVIKIANNEK